MQRIEYLVVEQPHFQRMEHLNKFLEGMGINGWDHYYVKEGPAIDQFYFKRVVKTPSRTKTKGEKK